MCRNNMNYAIAKVCSSRSISLQFLEGEIIFWSFFELIKTKLVSKGECCKILSDDSYKMAGQPRQLALYFLVGNSEKLNVPFVFRPKIPNLVPIADFSSCLCSGSGDEIEKFQQDHVKIFGVFTRHG